MEENLTKEIESIQKVYNEIIEFFVNYSFQIIGAIIIALLGWLVANKIANFVDSICKKNNLDVTLTKFIVLLVKYIIIICVMIIALGKLGIELTPFIAGIGAASLGAGLALQGMLSNYAAGLGIIITRPFVVGNTVTIQDFTGVVSEIKLGYTLLITEDKEIISIPNKYIIGEVLVNSFEYKIVESVIGVEYSSDIDKVCNVLNDVLENVPEIRNEPKFQVGIKEFGDFSINMELRYWAPTKSYFDIQYKVNKDIYDAFAKNGINIPFPTHNIINNKKDEI